MSRKKLEDWRKRGQRQPLWGAKVYERCSELPPGANGSSPNRELLAFFRFQPGFNLLVGINGVGKTSVLEALAICLSPALKQIHHLRTKIVSPTKDDIRLGADSMTLTCKIALNDREFTYLVHLPREKYLAAKDPNELGDSESKKFIKSGFESMVPMVGAMPPVAVLYATRRAVPSERVAAADKAEGGVNAALADALVNRELRLSEFAAWMRVQKVLAAGRPSANRVLTALNEAVKRFLVGYDHLRPSDDRKPKLLIDRNGETLEVRYLSDGERGTLVLVLDLTRRLAQANPDFSDPAAEAEAVVLIDEIDLHLHPEWQRQIVHRLTTAFPRCQFIATTHSPQVIGEVAHETIQIIGDGQVSSPSHSFGVDSSRVLEEIMDARPRTKSVQELLTEFSRTSTAGDLSRARDLLAELASQLGEDDPEITRARTLLEFMGDDQ